MESGRHEWRVPPFVVAAKVLATAVFALIALWFQSDVARFAVAAFAALLLGAYAVRDLVHPVRLRADRSGVYVSRGFLGERHLEWGEIARIRVDRRRRLAGTSKLLEIDIDSTLYLFSRAEIGEEPEDAAATLSRLRDSAEH